MKAKKKKLTSGTRHQSSTSGMVSRARPAIQQIIPAISMLARVATFLLSLVYLCPLKFYPISPGLDPSWAYAMNLAHSKGLVWGRDIGFTYGPWSFLSIAMNVGSNFETALLFQAGCWFLLIPVLGFLLIYRRPALAGVVAFASTLGFGQYAINGFGYAGLEQYFEILVVLLLACAHIAKRWEPPLVLATLIGALAMMIKFSAGIFAFGAVISFGLATLIQDRAKAVRSLIIGCVLPPVSIAALYFIHHPSLSTMTGYLRTSMERSDAYSISNSLPSGPQELLAAGLLSGVYLLIAVLLAVTKDKAAPFAVMLLVPWFFIFKHGFIRADSHVGIFFTLGACMVGILLLLVDFHQPRRSFYAAALIVSLLYALPVFQPAMGHIFSRRASLATAIRVVGQRLEILRVPSLKQRLDAESAAYLSTDRLPAELLTRLEQKTITPFPWELAFGTANKINMAMMPMLQSYGADSAWLDRWNGQLFENAASRPEYLLLEWNAIDERHVLLDVPSGSLSIYQWYEFDSRYGDQLLLRRRASQRSSAVRDLGESHGAIGTLIDVPESRHPITGSVRMKLTPYGRLVKFCYKVPEVYLYAFGGDGAAWRNRIVPDVLSNQGPISFLPFDLNGMEDLMARNHVGSRIRKFMISGPGAALYESEVEVRFAELADVELTEGPRATSEFENVPSGFTVDTWRIDTINGEDGGFRKQVSYSKAPPFIWLKGWAVDPISGDCASAVAIEVDGGRLTQAVYGLPYPSIPIVLKDQKCTTAGFEWALPLSKGKHTLQLKILSSKRDIWYRANFPIEVFLGGDIVAP